MTIYFYFFDNINDEPIIQAAFRMVCGDKLMHDGYCDMDEFINKRKTKSEILDSLLSIYSPFVDLYKMPYPSSENIVEKWHDYSKGMSVQFDKKNVSDRSSIPEFFSYIEANAIIHWLYSTYSTIDKRKDVTKELTEALQELYDMDELFFDGSIIYVKEKIEIVRIDSFESFHYRFEYMMLNAGATYYRGHSNANYELIPAIQRRKKWIDNEHVMYNELRIECPFDFEKCITHLDYLVHMQHYGLPTRLLDITNNPLVALYFACSSQENVNGELIVLNVNVDSIKYPKSDTVSILASLPLFDYEVKQQISEAANNPSVSKEDFNQIADKLLHEIRFEKPAFRDEIEKLDIVNSFLVLSEKRNNRIIKQDGAFIICGLFESGKNPIDKYRYKDNGKTQVFIIENHAKQLILEQLDNYSINRASLFPEISDVATFIRDKYK